MGCFLIGCGVWEKSFRSLFFFYPFSLFCLYAGVCIESQGEMTCDVQASVHNLS